MSRQNITTLDFINESSEKHSNFYRYDKSIYVKTSEKVIITCPIHGDFQQTPNSHLGGAGCRECSKSKISKALTKTQDQFIKESLKAHGNVYDYSNIVYINGDIKVKIICKKHGEFEQSPNLHIKGAGCTKCSRRLNKEKFIKKASDRHNNFYNYSKIVFINSQTKLVIACPIHGDFEQNPLIHLQGRGCNECGKNATKKAISSNTEKFAQKSKEKHGDKYDYSKVEYVNNRTKVTIICPIHEDFTQRPSDHINGSGCQKCAIESSKYTTESFIKKAKEVHNNLFSYENTIYIHNKNKVIITCKIHGDFEQRPANHLNGNGCYKCGNMDNWSRSGYIKTTKGRKCTFYILRCFNETEKFYKIGITSNSIKKRYNTKNSMPYTYEVISEIIGEAGFIWDLELQEKRKLKEFNYQPKIFFEGSKTECFTQYDIDATTK